jgi:hypothetical protein
VAPPAHAQSLRSYFLLHCVGQFTQGAFKLGIQQACHVTNRKLCINSLAFSMGRCQFFKSLLIHPKSDMVNTHSSHPLPPPTSTPRVSNNPEIQDFLRSMAESMEFLRKQNEDLRKQNENLDTRLTAVEA